MPTFSTRSSFRLQLSTLFRDGRRRSTLAVVWLAVLVVTAGIASADGVEPTPSQPLPVTVKIHGESGSPVFLIPGLGSPGEVWDATVAKLLEEGYSAHVFTLAGFAGRPPIDGDFLPRVHAALVAAAREQESPPALIGHSLGAVLSFWLAASEPELFGPVVAVDGVPFLPALMTPGATAENARPQADAMHAMISGMTPEAYDRQTALTLSTMITDPSEARRVAEMSRGSDPSSIAEAMRDLMTRDLRQAVAAIRSPVLLIGAGAPATTPEAAVDLAARYQDQVAAVPDHRVEMLEMARHFVMIDAPERFLELTLDHLARSSRR